MAVLGGGSEWMGGFSGGGEAIPRSSLPVV